MQKGKKDKYKETNKRKVEVWASLMRLGPLGAGLWPKVVLVAGCWVRKQGI